MVRTSLTTGYARLAPRQARAVLAVITVTMGLGVAVTLSPLASTNDIPRANDANDVALYRAEAVRIHQGEGYYQAAAAELSARGYPTRSVFNWRTPLPMWLVGKMPAMGLGKALLGGLALTLMLMAFEALAREENNVLLRPAACALLLTGAVLPTILGDLFVMPVLWAGVLIALSACAYGVNRPYLAVAMGLAALFFRELALPYCVLCVAIDWWHGRRGQWVAWMIGLAAWLAFFGLHWWTVSGLIAPDAIAHRHGWIQFGGAGFVISTAQMNAYLLLLPQWVTAIYLVAAMVGLAGWSTPLGSRIGLSTCLYLMALAVVGQSFNQYWGSLIAPLLCFGVVRFPASLGDLCRAVGIALRKKNAANAG
jgi:hypothetical protein